MLAAIPPIGDRQQKNLYRPAQMFDTILDKPTWNDPIALQNPTRWSSQKAQYPEWIHFRYMRHPQSYYFFPRQYSQNAKRQILLLVCRS